MDRITPVILNTEKVYDSEISEYGAMDNISGVDMIKFSNGSIVIAENTGIIALDKEKYCTRLIPIIN